MATFSLKVIDRNDSTICVSSGEDFVDLVCMRAYEEGDRIVLETSDKNAYVNWQVDDALGAAFVYITDNVSSGRSASACRPRCSPAAATTSTSRPPGQTR